MIRLEELAKHYGEIRAVDGVSLDVERGEVFGLLGPNGAGKTTIVRVLSTLASPTAGRALVAGHDVAKQPMEVKKLIGVAPQEINLDMELTAYENLKIHGMLHGMKDIRRRAHETLEWLELGDRADGIVRTLSGGSKRRLLIGRALMHRPRVLFLDEPTVGLDPQIRREIWDTVRSLQREGVTLLLSTHYIEEAENLCGQVGILNHGKLLVEGKPSDLKARVGRFVVESLDGGRTEHRFFRDRRDAAGFAGQLDGDAVIREATLEDVFVDLTGDRIER